MASRNLKDWFFTLAVLATVIFIAYFSHLFSLGEASGTTNEFLPPRAELMFSKVDTSGFGNVEVSLLSIDGVVFGIQHFGQGRFVVRNIAAGDGVNLVVDAGDDSLYTMISNESMSFDSRLIGMSLFRLIITVNGPDYKMTCIAFGSIHQRSHGMILNCN